MTPRPLLLALLAALTLAALPSEAAAQPASPSQSTCDFSEVPGVVWWGTERQMTVERFVSYLAPIYWFSPDEPLMHRAQGADLRLPETMPFEDYPDRPVVYYQINEVLQRTDALADGPAFFADGADPAAALLDLHNVVTARVLFVAYFTDEEGLGAHPHDTEATEMKVVVARSDWPAVREHTDVPCAQPHYILAVTRTSAKAHGLEWFWNVIETDETTSFPMHLLVEEGKHGIATDKNGDGAFTPGYDVNVRINDAWGVRDILRTGYVFTGAWEPWMAKVRRPEHRVFPPLPEDSPLRAHLAALVDGQPHAVYALRPYPSAEWAGDDPALRHIIENHEVPGWPKLDEVSVATEVDDWVDEGLALKSLSISMRADGDLGFSFVFPFFVVKHLEDPMTGGYILQRMYLKDSGLRDFGWMAMWMPSASRWLDTYLAAGGEWDEEIGPSGETLSSWDFVFETGLKFRVNMSYSPLKFLTFLTPYWGLRLGVKNRGFFEVNDISYVIEFGAGSF